MTTLNPLQRFIALMLTPAPKRPRKLKIKRPAWLK
jgi:hypothetical protein